MKNKSSESNILIFPGNRAKSTKTLSRKHAAKNRFRLDFNLVLGFIVVLTVIAVAAFKISSTQNIPVSGEVLFNNGAPCTAPFTYDASICKKHSVVKIKDGAGNDVFSFFVRAGEKATVYVPVGTYNVFYANGTVWRGKENLFGINTEFYKMNEPLPFANTADELGTTITFYDQFMGNRNSHIVSAKSFE